MPVLGMIGKIDEHAINGVGAAVAGQLDSQGGPGSGAGWSVLDQLHVARRPGPSQPWWNGTQNCDMDLSDMRFAKLNTSWGKNFVENKMPEAHWKLESMERGARIVVITPEYNPTASRADYWIPVRPETDGAPFLGACKIILDENIRHQLHQGIYRYADLVRTDTLQYLDPQEVLKDYRFPDFRSRTPAGCKV